MGTHGVAKSMYEEMQVAIKAAISGGEVLLHYFKDRKYCTKAKSDSSLQTTADLEAERIILDIIRAAFPDHSIKSEESELISSASSEYQWLVDPLDGTENFFLGIPYFSTSIALCKEGIPQIAVVYNPVTEELYTAEAGKGAWLNNAVIHVSRSVTLKGSRAFFIPIFIQNVNRRQPISGNNCTSSAEDFSILGHQLLIGVLLPVEKLIS